MKYLLFFIFFLIVVGIGIIYINISKVNVENNPITAKTNKIKKEEFNILKALGNSIKVDIFPAEELYIKVDLNKVPKTKILYQLILNHLNKYQIFGIKQILGLNNIHYSFIKSKNDLKLFINFDKKSQANKLKQLFENYNFNVRLKKLRIKG